MTHCSNPHCACGGVPRVVTVGGREYTARHVRDEWLDGGHQWRRLYDVDGVGRVSAHQDMLAPSIEIALRPR